MEDWPAFQQKDPVTFPCERGQAEQAEPGQSHGVCKKRHRCGGRPKTVPNLIKKKNFGGPKRGKNRDGSAGKEENIKERQMRRQSRPRLGKLGRKKRWGTNSFDRNAVRGGPGERRMKIAKKGEYER